MDPNEVKDKVNVCPLLTPLLRNSGALMCTKNRALRAKKIPAQGERESSNH